MDYLKTKLQVNFKIDEIISFHFYEFSKDFIFAGEQHDFWEIVYIDSGAMLVCAGTTEYCIHQGEMIVHKPLEFHNLRGNGLTSANVVAFNFVCDSPALKLLENHIIRLDEKERKVLASIITEAYNIYDSKMNVPDVYLHRKRKDPPFESEHMYKLYLEQLIILCIRRESDKNLTNKLITQSLEYADSELVRSAIEFMRENLSKTLSIQTIADALYVSRAQLIATFKKNINVGVIEYFIRLRNEEAKLLIRNGKFNITEIANKLGYSSIHYFCRIFKQTNGMSPSEYAKSIKAKTIVTKANNI